MRELCLYEHHDGGEELQVGLFFYVEDHFIFSGCPLSKAESYGDFLVYPGSHFVVWEGLKHLRYAGHGSSRRAVDYDYFPRGRVVYRKSDDTFIIYHDRCITNRIDRVASRYRGCKVRLELDEHYCCHMCNEGYVM